MAKELGQIHTVNYSQAITNTGAAQNAINVDLPGQLSEQLQTIIRAGTYHKCVGIDMTLDTVGTVGGGQITGYIRYYAPTKGRCEAFRGAFKAMKEQMKTQGVDTRTNPLYDFKAPLNEFSHLSGPFPNRATLDGTNGLALYNQTVLGASIFDVHNRNVQPTFTGAAGDMFQPGFDTLLQSSAGTDFVLNDAVPFTGNRNTASTEYEMIPFMLTWTPDTTDLAVVWNWRPDPALFLAILCGQMSIVVEEVNLDGSPSPAPAVNLNVAVMVSGWKSIMGDPSKRKSRKSSSKKSTPKMVKK
jgi:hypothetical protein